MTRFAAYVVLILLAFIFASTAQDWPVRVRVSDDAVAKLAEKLDGPDPHSPASAIPIIIGRDVYAAACAQCHGTPVRLSGFGVLLPPTEYSPRDIQKLITWGISNGTTENPGIVLGKNHPVFPARLTDTERWAVAMYANSAWLDPDVAEDDALWMDLWKQGLDNEPDPATSGTGLYQRLCATCHGTMGYGNGPLSNDLLPPPADFQDTAWVAGLSDSYIHNVIRDGKPGYRAQSPENETETGAAWSGMPAWGDYLDLFSVARLTAYIRSFGYTYDSAEQVDENDFIAVNEIIVPDTNTWTWSEIRRILPGASGEPPGWLQREIE